MEQWLRERGVEERDLAEALSRLIEAGAVDDERFARRYAEDKRELAGWGPDRIRLALAERGVASGLIDQALAGDDEAEQVRRAAKLLEARGARADTDPERARALSALARRGYSLEVAYEAVRTVERRSAEASG